MIKINMKGNLLTKDKKKNGTETGRESETGEQLGIPGSTARKHSHICGFVSDWTGW